MRLSISRQAQTDLDGIWIYIAQESGSAEIADRVLDSVGKTLRVIRLFPYAGRSREADLRPGVRSFPAGNYVIFYRIEQSGVYILRVLHGSRDTKAFFTEP
jgi:toxin ParE1/3/4